MRIRHVIALLVFSCCISLLSAVLPLPSNAEWYVGGYGGYSVPDKLREAEMPLLGEQQAQALFPQFNPNVGDTLTSSLRTSNISLESSAIFGAKGGYFFKDEGFNWLGVEVDVFTSKPTIKQQTVTTVLDATFIPNNIAPPLSVPTTISQSGTLVLEESSVRMVAATFNVVARYPGKQFQPYAGLGGGGFHFSSSGQIDGRQVVPGFHAQAGLKFLATEEWGLFAEGKYHLASIDNLDPTFGLTGLFSIFHFVAGVAYHF